MSIHKKPTKPMRTAAIVDRFTPTPANIAKVVLRARARGAERKFDADTELQEMNVRLHALTGVGLDSDGLDELFRLITAIGDRELQVVPKHAWVSVVDKIETMTATKAVREVRRVRQMSSRGWSETDHWGLKHVLAHRLHGQLTDFADNLTGHPTRYGADTWEYLVRDAAGKLGRYASDTDDAEMEQTLASWSRAAECGDPNAGALFDDLRELEAEREREAVEAMQWIADNFGDLWD